MSGKRRAPTRGLARLSAANKQSTRYAVAYPALRRARRQARTPSGSKCFSISRTSGLRPWSRVGRYGSIWDDCGARHGMIECAHRAEARSYELALVRAASKPIGTPFECAAPGDAQESTLIIQGEPSALRGMANRCNLWDQASRRRSDPLLPEAHPWRSGWAGPDSR